MIKSGKGGKGIQVQFYAPQLSGYFSTCEKRDVLLKNSLVHCFSNKGTTGRWNVRTMNQDIFHIRLEISRFIIDIIGTGKLKWAGMRHFASEKHFQRKKIIEIEHC